MSQSIDDRLAAIRELATQMGKDPASVLASVAPTWAIGPFELAQLAASLKQSPPPTQAQAAAEAKAQEAARLEALKHEHKARVLEISDSRRYRELRRSGRLFEAVDFARGRPHVYKDPGDDPPPTAA